MYMLQYPPLNNTELRKRREKTEVVKVMLADYKRSLDGDGVVNQEVAAMLIEDLLSTLIYQESLVAQHIAVMYSGHQEDGTNFIINAALRTVRTIWEYHTHHQYYYHYQYHYATVFNALIFIFVIFYHILLSISMIIIILFYIRGIVP
jgi:hypothetical protein